MEDCARSSKPHVRAGCRQAAPFSKNRPYPIRDFPGANRARRMGGRHTGPYRCTSTRRMTRLCQPYVRTVRDQSWKRPSRRSTRKDLPLVRPIVRAFHNPLNKDQQVSAGDCLSHTRRRINEQTIRARTPNRAPACTARTTAPPCCPVARTMAISGLLQNAGDRYRAVAGIHRSPRGDAGTAPID
jgi:hypothetical protein